MKTFLDLITISSCLIFVVSAVVISFYFSNRGIYTYWQLQWKVLWLEIIFRYRDHTKKYERHVGAWYYILSVSAAIFLISILTELAIQLRNTSWPIIFIIVFSASTLLPLLGYAIFSLSKEKHY